MEFSQAAVSLGIGFLALGFLLVIAGSIIQGTGRGEAEVKGGGVVFIGPIPIVFGSDSRYAGAAIAFAAAALTLLYLHSRL